MTKYKWKDNFPAPAVGADVFGAVIDRLEEEKGVVVPEDVVLAAADASSPIHALFQWDDAAAAHSYRKRQARNLMGGLQVVRVHVESNGPVSDRAYHVARTENGQRGYVNRSRIMGDADLRKQVIANARRELEAFLRKFQHVAALGKYVPDLQRVVDQMRDDADEVVLAATKRVEPDRAPETV